MQSKAGALVDFKLQNLGIWAKRFTLSCTLNISHCCGSCCRAVVGIFMGSSSAEYSLMTMTPSIIWRGGHRIIIAVPVFAFVRARYWPRTTCNFHGCPSNFRQHRRRSCPKEKLLHPLSSLRAHNIRQGKCTVSYVAVHHFPRRRGRLRLALNILGVLL